MRGVRALRLAGGLLRARDMRCHYELRLRVPARPRALPMAAMVVAAARLAACIQARQLEPRSDT